MSEGANPTTIDQACAALDFMAKWAIEPKPENYTVWLHYQTGSMPDLNHAIDLMMASGDRPTDAFSAALYARYFDTAATSIRNLMGSIEESVAHAITALDDAGRGARDYQAALGNSAVSLTKEPELGRIGDIVRRVLIDTKTMIERNDTLEQQLSRSTAEISDLRRQIEQAERAAFTDQLTEIGNRKLFDDRLTALMGEAADQDTDLSMILLDIDHFKAFNDSYGHQFGDLVLKLVARLLSEGIRPGDIATRYGGEEFALLLPRTAMSGAVAIAQSVCRQISTRRIIKKGNKEALGNVTLSAGVATYEHGESWAAFIARADSALYQAKAAGRNRVIGQSKADWTAPREIDLSSVTEEIRV